MNQQKMMDILARNGISALNAILGDDPSNSDSDDDTHESTLFQFLKKKNNEIGQPAIESKPNALLKPDPLLPMPPEMYRKGLSKENRRRLFFKHLKRRDILYLQVINDKLADNFKCVVLAKHGDLMLLEDLSLVMYFPKLPPELKLLKEKLSVFDLIRGAFWTVSLERMMFVTIDSCIYTEKEKETLPKLGNITRKDLPHYVGREKVGMTYAGYVQRSAGYKDDRFCMKQLQDCVGIDTNRIHSFRGDWDGKQYPKSECLEELQKYLTPEPSVEKLYKSYEYFRENNMVKALNYSNKALSLNPDNIDARVARGAVYANLGKMKKAFTDTEDALKLDPLHASAKRQMSELLVSASKQHLVQKNYGAWHECLTLARTYNSTNPEAQELLSKAKYETVASTSSDPTPSRLLIPPSWADVAHIYKRIMAHQERIAKLYKKQKKRKRKHRRRAERYRSQERSSTIGRPIPCISNRRRQKKSHAARSSPVPPPIFDTSQPSTSSGRREVFRRPSSTVFRRPFPPGDPIPRPPI